MKTNKKNSIDSIPHIQLVRKLAWSFYYTTGFEFNELFQESILEYYESLPEYDPEKGAITTYLSHRIRNRLLNYLAKERRTVTLPDTYDVAYSTPTPWWQIAETFTGKVAKLIDVLMTDDSIDINQPGKMVRGDLQRRLQELGWKRSEIWGTYRELKQLVNEM